MYNTKIEYIITHILLGSIAYFYPLLWIGILSYQLLQLYLNVRFFPLQRKILQGNSLLYTIYKIFQYVLGFLLVFTNFLLD